jgi:glycerol uptake facilitator-like aquaporin
LTGGISGGLINPSLTLALATWRGFPWKKVPGYILAQMLGGTAGALLCYGLYATPIRLADPNQTETTAALFTT